jgi:ATP-dependent Lon protease
VAKHIGLAFKSEQVLKIPPILLTGPPGLGKTHFAKDLASALCAPMHQLSFDSALASAALMGSDKNWGNTTSGIVFDAVVGGNDPVANPVILLDEVDKARDGGHYQSPISSLHSLLEPISSKSVMDISLSFIFDSSMVTWIACANHLELIATTIRSRFHIFEIKPPTGWAAVQLARCVAAACHEELAIEDFIKPGRDLIRLIFHLSAREQRKAWEDAFASAISDNRKHLEASDLPNDEPPTKPGKPNEWMH